MGSPHMGKKGLSGLFYLVIRRDHGAHRSLEEEVGFSAVEDALGRAHVREAYPPNVVHARQMPFRTEPYPEVAKLCLERDPPRGHERYLRGSRDERRHVLKRERPGRPWHAHAATADRSREWRRRPLEPALLAARGRVGARNPDVAAARLEAFGAAAGGVEGEAARAHAIDHHRALQVRLRLHRNTLRGRGGS